MATPVTREQVKPEFYEFMACVDDRVKRDEAFILTAAQYFVVRPMLHCFRFLSLETFMSAYLQFNQLDSVVDLMGARPEDLKGIPKEESSGIKSFIRRCINKANQQFTESFGKALGAQQQQQNSTSEIKALVDAVRSEEACCPLPLSRFLQLHACFAQHCR